MQTFPAYLLFIRTDLPAMKRFPAPFLTGQASTGISSYLRSRAFGLYAVVERLVRQSIHRLSRFTALLVLLKVSFGIDVVEKRDHTEGGGVLRGAATGLPIEGGPVTQRAFCGRGRAATGQPIEGGPVYLMLGLSSIGKDSFDTLYYYVEF